MGNSIAGTSAVKAIREIDKENKIILISDEKYLNYSRPLISYLLAQKVSSDRLNYLPNDFYQKNNVELLLNKKALKLDIKDKNVLLNDKSKIKYDKLLLTTSKTTIIPQISELDCESVFNFMKLSDIEKIEKYLKKNKVKKSVVIGAGLIGLKATEALMNINIKVSIIEIADRILPMTFDKQASEIYEELLKI
ncbi:MAG TPA: FAD-dependent oxidoreductase, partial [bacterium]|nr:FAD-dependent oxidoreductase [bacterium]